MNRLIQIQMEGLTSSGVIATPHRQASAFRLRVYLR